MRKRRIERNLAFPSEEFRAKLRRLTATVALHSPTNSESVRPVLAGNLIAASLIESKNG